MTEYLVTTVDTDGLVLHKYSSEYAPMFFQLFMGENLPCDIRLIQRVNISIIQVDHIIFKF